MQAVILESMLISHSSLCHVTAASCSETSFHAELEQMISDVSWSQILQTSHTIIQAAQLLPQLAVAHRSALSLAGQDIWMDEQ